MSANRERPRHERYVPNCPVAHGRDRCSHDSARVLGNDPLRAKPGDRRREMAAIAQEAYL